MNGSSQARRDLTPTRAPIRSLKRTVGGAEIPAAASALLLIELKGIGGGLLRGASSGPTLLNGLLILIG